ncbi:MULTISPECIES: hypothetical protein [Actinokineospora]|uniref:Uncharacterized protein n=1 Tax=Actinokineospora fastidiosa TaxID=1816 RepID=A0A918LDQ2_9PSEU|nr:MULTISPECIES: hypothetical protein [Actinokineospora]UVS80208.1 hypothetical protein Actkin_03958 [Actinokineospora sp. UTMC 2448]GGS33719.1 hypothetical protein GCM10010171_30000 [Actinokineospora fastidiosa]
MDELRRQFRAPLPDSVAGLPAEAADDLAAALRDARRRQTRHLMAATEESLEQLPRLIRPLVRKVIGL